MTDFLECDTTKKPRSMDELANAKASTRSRCVSIPIFFSVVLMVPCRDDTKKNSSMT